MKVSVVVGAYNEENYLLDAIRSIQHQTVANWELLIVDDGSQDTTLPLAQAVARGDTRIRVLSQPHGGIAIARNAGFAASHVHSDLLAFMDADDTWEPDALETLTAKLESDVHAVGVCGQAYYMNAQGEPFGGVKTPIGFPSQERIPFYQITEAFELPPGAFLLRRWACEAAGLFDPSVAGCEDWDFWTRLSLFGHFLALPKLVIGYRRHVANLTSHTRLIELSHRRFLQKTQSYRLARRAATAQAASPGGDLPPAETAHQTRLQQTRLHPTCP